MVQLQDALPNGPATHFLSWAWSYSLLTVTLALRTWRQVRRGSRSVWLDRVKALGATRGRKYRESMVNVDFWVLGLGRSSGQILGNSIHLSFIRRLRSGVIWGVDMGAHSPSDLQD